MARRHRRTLPIFQFDVLQSAAILGAPNHRIAAGDLDELKFEFLKLNVDTCLRVMGVYRSRREATASGSGSGSR
jgi:hypothetical protein